MNQTNHYFYADLFTLLELNCVVITPTHRAATQLQQEYARFQLTRNTYSTGNILSIQSWLQKLWQQYQDSDFLAPRLLNAWQAQCRWQSIVQQISPEARENAAALAQEAWTLLHTHQISLDEIITPLTEEVDFFKQCAQLFIDQSQKENLITIEMLPAFLAQKINRMSPLPQTIYCVGFDFISPAYRLLFAAFERQRCQVIQYEFPAQTTEVETLALKDSQSEWLHAAVWAKKLHAQDPSAMIGIVIPNIAAQWQSIQHIFARELMPESFWSPTLMPNYNISAGQSLLDLPIIKDALHLLSLDKKVVDMASLSTLLLSPFILGGTEFHASRALLETKLRKNNQAQWHWAIVLSKVENCKNLFPLLSKFVQSQIPVSATPSVWRQHIINMLAAWGWPGDAKLNTIEYQAVQHFLTVLNEFALLNDELGQINFAQAIRLLKTQAANAIFQRDTKTACIHVLGLLEASGLRFDALWVTGAHEKNFPAQLKPHPLLPIKLQQQYGMQEASHQTCLQFYEKLLQRLLQSAPQVKISFPQQVDETLCEPSPFIRNYPVNTTVKTVDAFSLAHALQTPDVMETWQDAKGPAVLSDNTVKGGTGILQSQAQCPFQAFVRYRLQAQGLEKVTLGFSPKQRGDLVHAILAKFWEEVKTQAVLLTLPEEMLQQKIAVYTDEVLMQHQHDVLPPLHLQAEKKRLQQLLYHWLMLEKQRPPFTVIGMETSRTLSINHLNLNLRIDRIDSTDAGAIVIDYKTGAVSKPDWLDTRPELAQLLAYALCVEECQGVALGLVQGKKPKLMGVFAEEDAVDWQSLTQHWQQILETLAREFCDGEAQVAPKYDKTCEQCDYSSVCRIKHALNEDSDDI